MTLLNVLKPSAPAKSSQQSPPANSNQPAYVRPRYEITEDENAYYVDVDLPGVPKKDVTLTLHDGILELVGERNWSAPKDWKPIGGDHESYAYRLRLMVGDRIGDQKISAETSNGVLRLTLPKEEEKKPRKIEIS